MIPRFQAFLMGGFSGCLLWRVGLNQNGFMSLVASVEAFLRRHRLLPDGEGIFAAVSGGVDSMVLLDILSGLAGRHGWKLTVAHCNHQLRGEASEGDERLVREVAGRLGWDFVLERADVKALARAKGVSVEMAGREIRHRFFARAALARGIERAVLAHHADDQAELFFLRALRGAGSEGLGGMRVSSRSPYTAGVRLVRPLLEQRKASLLEYAREHGLSFREDATNRNREVMRNRIRHEWLPRLVAAGVAGSVLRSMRILADEHRFIEEEGRRWLLGEGAGEFAELPVALQREIVCLELLRLGVVPSFSVIEVLRCSDAGRAVAVAGGRRLCRDGGGRLVEAAGEVGLAFSKAEVWVKVAAGLPAVFFGGLELRFTVQRVGDGGFPLGCGGGRLAAAGWRAEVFDAGSLGERVRLRHWRPGDRFRPIGMAGTVKLQDWFVNEKVPARERRRRVAAESGKSGLFWVEGMRIGERFKVTSCTKWVVRLKWRRREAI